MALRVFDGEQVGRLSIRDTAPGEKLPGEQGRAGAGHTGDRRRARPDRPALRRQAADWSGVERVSRRLTIAAIQVNGVPQISVDEALWMAAGLIDPAAEP